MRRWGMSWDAKLKAPESDPCETCGRSETADDIELGNYTHNCNNMVRAAMMGAGTFDKLPAGSLYNLNNMTGEQVASLLCPAMKWWGEHRETQRQHNPSNGWGDERSAFTWWGRIASTCAANPTGVLWIWG